MNQPPVSSRDGSIRSDAVAIYIRWSTDEQGEGTTAAVQQDGCEHYVRSQGWQVRPELMYVDDGHSGSGLNRPALTRLREAIARGDVDAVVLFKIDRLSRNVVDTVNLVLREWEGRCHVKCAREPIDTSTAAGKMFFYTLVSFAEWERSVIRERTLSGKLRRLQEGRNPGFRPPYGLRVGPSRGSFALIPEEAAVVQLIFERYLLGRGYTRIADELTARGLRLRSGRPFTARAVSDILANPLYAGRLVYGRRRSATSKGMDRQGATQGPLNVTAADLPVIIPPDCFKQAQLLRAKRTKLGQPNRAQSSQHLLTGLLRCRCHSALVGVRSGNSAYYVCGGKRSRSNPLCVAAHIRQDALDQWLVDRVITRFSDQLTLLKPKPSTAAERMALKAAWGKLKRDLVELEREARVVARDYRRELLTPAQFQDQLEAVAARRRELLQDRVVLDQHMTATESRHQDSIPLPEIWQRLPHPIRKQLLREFVAELIVYRAAGSPRVEYSLLWTGPGN